MGNKNDFSSSKELIGEFHQHMMHYHSKEVISKASEIKFPLSTHHAAIVDETGKRVKLAGTNWSGGHMSRHCVDGLECRPLKDIVVDIRDKFKMNCVRLTYSLQLFYEDNVIPEQFIQANPDLKGKTAMEIFDITIKVLT